MSGEAKKCDYCDGFGKAAESDGGFYTCPQCHGVGHIHEDTASGVKVYGLWRNDERKADVVVLTSGKCVVAWPTSVIVYDSLQAAKDVHITHMGGRGEETTFKPEQSG